MSRILVVDDEEKIRTMISKYAVFEGHEVSEAVNGMDAIEKAKADDFDIIIMDVMMPELDGFSAVKEIHKTKDIPVIMLSARGEEYDKIHGFEIGVDDYIVKPFSPKELMMRVAAILKRTSGNKKSEEAHDTFTYQDLVVDYSAHTVSIKGNKLELSPKEYDLLVYLVQNKNIALTRENFISKVWGYDFYGDDRTLDTHIKLLRRSLQEYSDCIVTVRGVGYRFETQE